MRSVHCGLAALLWLVTEHAGAQQADPDVPRGAPPLTQDATTQLPADPPATEASPLPEELSEMSVEEELRALGVDLNAHGVDTDLHLSGFMDVNFFAQLNAKDAPLNTLAYGDKPALFVGRLNVYATKNITDYFSMMAELRFVYSPNGSQGGGAGAGTDTSYSQVLDYTGSGGYLRWGGIVVERAYGQWNPSPFFTLRLGSFLTPYGIWNVDHGSPVFIPINRPFAVTGNFFPERQTGVELFGRWAVSNDLTVRYHLTLSNGLGPVSEYRDLDANKALGGRLILEYIKLGTLQVGGSAFHGKNTAGKTGFGVDAQGTAVTLQKTLSEQSVITALAADLSWKHRGFHFQGEWVGQRVRYTEAGRTRIAAAGQVGIPVNALAADVFNWAAYALAGYRLPWWGIMPYMTLEYQRSNNYGLHTETTFSKVGINVRPTGPIVVKTEYMFALSGTAGTEVKLLAVQVAWAF